MRKVLSFLILAVALKVSAQVNIPPGVIKVGTAPSGACAQGTAGQLVTTTGAVWTCQNITAGTGTWTVLSSGGAGAVSSVSNSDGTLTISPTIGAVIASIALSHANTWTGAQSFTQPIAVGTSPPIGACPSPVIGCWAASEGSTAGTPGAGYDYIRADSTAHTFKFSLNGGAEQALGTAAFQPSSTFLQKANNLSDLASIPAAQLNIVEPQVYFNKIICPGDSITFKFQTSNNVGSLCDWLGWHVGVPASDRGMTGYWSYQEDPLLMGYADLPTTSAGVVAYTIGTNNYFNLGNSTPGAYQYGQNVLAQYAFLAIPSTQRTFAKNWALTGTWVAATASANGRQTTGSGSTATFTATGSIIYVGYQAVSASPGTATMACDGTATGATFDISASASGGTLLNTYQSQLVRVTGLTNTTHTCVITSGSSGTVGLLWAAGLNGSNQPTWPVVLAGSIPTHNVTTGDFAPMYRAYQPTEVSLLNGDGLVNLIYVNNTSALTVGINFADALHPNDYGYYLLSQPYIAALDTWLALPVALFNLPYSGVGANTSLYGTGNLALGAGSLQLINSTTPGTNDTCFGYSSCPVMTTASNNTTVGTGGLGADTTGASNSTFGATAGTAITTGSNNALFGAAAGSGLTTSQNNSMFGVNTGRNANTAGNNSYFGEASGLNNTTGSSNSYFGYQSGQIQTTGSQNAAFGGNAGSSTGITVLNNCTFMGYNAQASVTGLTNCAAYGFGAQVAASNTQVFGSSATIQTVYFGGLLPGTLYSAAGTVLPTCAAALKGQQATVTDATSPTFMGAYTSGGTITWPFVCSYNGTTYAWAAL